MRIVTITKSWPTRESPVRGTFIHSRVTALSDLADVRVLHPVWRTGAGGGDDGAPGPPVHRVRYRYLPGLLKGLDHCFLARSLRPTLDRWSRTAPFDVLVAELGYPEGAAAVALGARYGVPVAVTLRGTERDFHGRGGRGRAMAAALRHADLVLAVSRDLAVLARECGAPAERVRVVHNGVDTERFAPGDRPGARRRLGLAPRARWLLSVGLLIERKGHDRAISALAALSGSHPDLRLAIVGDGPRKWRLRRQAKRLRVADRVHFAGMVPPRDVPDWFRAADLLVLASRREGLANVLLQARASGLPVVTTDVGGAREVIAWPAAGRVVPLGDPEALLAAIRGVLGGGADAAAIRDAAPVDTWEESGARVHGALREMLARG